MSSAQRVAQMSGEPPQVPYPFSFLAAAYAPLEPTLPNQCTSSLEHDEAEMQESGLLPYETDNDDQARLRREKNRLAAKRCRQKKNEMIKKIQAEYRELQAQSQELQMQALAVSKMYAREVKIRESMETLIRTLWGQKAIDELLGLYNGIIGAGASDLPTSAAPASMQFQLPQQLPSLP